VLSARNPLHPSIYSELSFNHEFSTLTFSAKDFKEMDTRVLWMLNQH